MFLSIFFFTNYLENCILSLFSARSFCLSSLSHTHINNLSHNSHTNSFSVSSHNICLILFFLQISYQSRTVHIGQKRMKVLLWMLTIMCGLNLEIRQPYIGQICADKRQRFEHLILVELSLAHSHVCWSVSLTLCIRVSIWHAHREQFAWAKWL